MPGKILDSQYDWDNNISSAGLLRTQPNAERGVEEMRIFVAYGYNDRDRWIPRLVFPVIRAFGDEVVTGEDMGGEVLSEAVRRRIERSDALIAFVTRRGEPNNGRWETHRWVTDELAHAIGRVRSVLEIREEGVTDQGGMAGDRQRIPYDETKRDECIVEIVKTLGNWHLTNSVTMQLLPEDCVEQILPLLNNPRLRCSYRVLEDGEESEPVATTIRRITGGLFVQARNIPRRALVQLNVECDGRMWSSDFENTDALSIRLRQD
jgi:hypothetical protein